MAIRSDVVLINPGGKGPVYGSLANEYAAVETPLWLALLAAYLRDRGFRVGIIDAEAEHLTARQAVARALESEPLLCAVGAIGGNPSVSSTPKMPAVRAVLEELRQQSTNVRSVIFGIHPSGVPERTLREEPVDFLCRGETFLCITDLVMALRNGGDTGNIQGLWYKQNDQVVDRGWARQIENLDVLPLAAWDLLPMDRYRAHNWHCFGHLEDRASYAMVYTSLGCPYNCSYCNIHALYGGGGIRFRSAGKVLEEIDLLVTKYKVRNFKFVDELFVVNPRRMDEVCLGLAERKYDINIWVYARIDTVNEAILGKLYRAGVRWIAYGIEGANTEVRKGVAKGRFDREKILQVIRQTNEAGIYVIGNYMFGLPDDDMSTMQETLDLAVELNCEYANFYVTMAYPGAALYDTAVREGLPLPACWEGYSQFNRHTVPLPSKYLSSAEILRFRDNAFTQYFGSSRYQDMILRKFGQPTLDHVRGLLTHKLPRVLLGD